jgi:hypothetical protein
MPDLGMDAGAALSAGEDDGAPPDEFGATDAAAGGPEVMGRERR